MNIQSSFIKNTFLSKIALLIIMGLSIIPSLTVAQDNLTDQEIINRGLNEFIDPSEAPLYDQVYTTITFKNGVTLDDLEDLQEVTPIFNGEGENAPTFYTKLGQKVDGVEQTTPIRSAKDFNEIRQKFSSAIQDLRSKNIEVEESKATNPRVYSVSFNHDPENEDVKSFKALAGEKEVISVEKKEALLNKLKQAKQNRGAKLDATLAGDVLTQEGLEDEVEEISSTSNEELMDILYPPQEQIEEINKEIKEERKRYLEHEKNLNEGKFEDKKSIFINVWKSIQSFLINPLKALDLNNFNDHLLMYSSQADWLTIEVPANNYQNGTPLKLHYRNNSYAQDFYFNDFTNEIRLYQNHGKCLDVDGGNFWNGQKVQVYDCNLTPA